MNNKINNNWARLPGGASNSGRREEEKELLELWVIDRQDWVRPPVRIVQWSRRLATEVFHQCGVPPTGEISLVLVDDLGMRELNRDYRGIDRSTDVLSFPQAEGQGDATLEPPAGNVKEAPAWGDVVINLHWAKLMARALELPLLWELSLLLVHGLLHLLGYDHQGSQANRDMQFREWRVLRRLLGDEGAIKILRVWRDDSRKRRVDEELTNCGMGVRCNLVDLLGQNKY